MWFPICKCPGWFGTHCGGSLCGDWAPMSFHERRLLLPFLTSGPTDVCMPCLLCALPERQLQPC